MTDNQTEISTTPRYVKCPTCGTRVEWTTQQRWRPFCSERCRLIDLGKWFDEANRIPAEEGIAEKPETH